MQVDPKSINVYLIPMTHDHSLPASTFSQYKGNLPRHLIALSRHTQSSVMQQLQAEYHHRGLRMSFEPYISIIGEGCRLNELSGRLGVSKQSCNQTVNQMEKAAYIKRMVDPRDGRGKIVVLTRQGKTLLKDGSKVITAVISDFEREVGAQSLSSFSQLLFNLAQGLSLRGTEGGDSADPVYLGSLLPRCSDYIMQRLMALTISKGHPGLKMSHGTVLTLIGSKPAHIQEIAKVHAVSKQAVSAIVKDLENLDYVGRIADPNYNRQKLLLLTTRGEQLITDSVDCVHQLEGEFEAILGNRGLQQLVSISKQLYLGLELEARFQDAARGDVNELAQQLKAQLNKKELGELMGLLQRK